MYRMRERSLRISCFQCTGVLLFLAARMFTLPSSPRSLPDRAANVRVKVSGGFLRQSRDLGVRGLPPGLCAVCRLSGLRPVSERP